MQSPDPPLFGSMNKVGFLFSARVMLSHGFKRYYEPLRLPIQPGEISDNSLYPPVDGTAPSLHWVSRTVLLFFRYMPSLLPREITQDASVLPSRVQRPSFSVQKVGISALVNEATYRFTCVTACTFAHRKLTTPDYSGAASWC